jgi:hypothetical protein
MDDHFAGSEDAHGAPGPHHPFVGVGAGVVV